MKRKFVLSAFLFLVVINCFAHGGGTDKNGGHHDRKNGGYHYHHGNKAHQHPNGICELSMKKYNAVNSKNTKSKESSQFLKVVLVGLLGFGAGYAINRKKSA